MQACVAGAWLCEGSVAPLEELASDEASVGGVSWIAGEEPSGPVEAVVKVRSGHAGTPSRVEARGDRRARVVFQEPVRAVAPGQAAVFYRGDEVLGGGWIEETPR